MTHKLEADSIQLEFNLRKILSDIYIKCETGKITGLLGRNGQGKSCLLNVIYGNLNAYSSSVRFDGKSIHHAFKRPDLLLFLPQFNFIPKSLTLQRIFRDFNLDYSHFENIFPAFNATFKSAMHDLAGGQRRLIEIYLIIKSKTQFAMLDEPFTHITPVYIEKLSALLIEEKKNKGLLITDHMYRHIIDICDSLYILKNGKTHLTKSISDIEELGYAKF